MFRKAGKHFIDCSWGEITVLVFRVKRMNDRLSYSKSQDIDSGSFIFNDLQLEFYLYFAQVRLRR